MQVVEDGAALESLQKVSAKTRKVLNRIFFREARVKENNAAIQQLEEELVQKYPKSKRVHASSIRWSDRLQEKEKSQ